MKKNTLRKTILESIESVFKKSNESYFDGEYLVKKICFNDLAKAIEKDLIKKGIVK